MRNSPEGKIILAQWVINYVASLNLQKNFTTTTRKNDVKIKNWKTKETANTEIIHKECAPCYKFRHWLRESRKRENLVHDTLCSVGEIARSQCVKILKSSRRFEYRLSDYTNIRQQAPTHTNNRQQAQTHTNNRQQASTHSNQLQQVPTHTLIHVAVILPFKWVNQERWLLQSELWCCG